ncbi:MAG: cellulase family glycosylhydrolase [Planctomycetales bacterium]|nr:cellulase family glycosylhydrolase [Planctomycetales bacterium]MBN8628597.1 cellulase family glycosylhydrolase [Planctomycetota bacterium]
MTTFREVAVATAILVTFGSPTIGTAQNSALSWVRVADDRQGFVLTPSGRPFKAAGFNYDRDAAGRLLEDYWETEWKTVEEDFAEMKALGANVVRVHLQFGKFMDGPRLPNKTSLDRLGELLQLAERLSLYLDLTGLGCYHKQDVPVWYDKLSETDRWNAQAEFWKAVAGRCKDSPAVFCYDLMNEPVVPGGRRKEGEWLGGALAGKHFVQFITLDQAGRSRPSIASSWIRHLTQAIRQVDQRHLITVGLVDWSLARPGLTSGFVPEEISDDLDFLCVHLYPQAGKLKEDLDTLAGFAVGKPVVIEETFLLKCSAKELQEFINSSKTHASGWIGFYWGQTPDELRNSKGIGEALTLQWLELFQELRLANPN